MLSGGSRNSHYFLVIPMVALLLAAPRATASWDPLLRASQLYGEGQWSPSSTVRTGEPTEVASADFNGDGYPDLALPNEISGFLVAGNTVSVLLHTASSGYPRLYQDWANYVVGTAPRGIATPDLNLDGKPDIVTANLGGGPTGSVSVLLGTGGGFLPAQTYSTPGKSTGLIDTGDVNADGFPDVITLCQIGETGYGIDVFLATAGGGLAGPVQYSAGDNSPNPSFPFGLDVADATGDGILDVIVTDYYAEAAKILLGNNSGAFGTILPPIPTGNGPTGIAVVHLNADAVPDLAVTREGGIPNQNAPASILLGAGGGSFQPYFEISVSWGNGAKVVAGDMDNDGDHDLLFTSQGGPLIDGAVTLLRSHGDGTFDPPTQLLGLTPNGRAIPVDVNLDGYRDIVSPLGTLTEGSAHSVTVLLQEPTGGFDGGLLSNITGRIRDGVAADFDRDGKVDVAVVATDSVRIGIGNSEGIFNPGPSPIVIIAPVKVAAGDVNRDGIQDLVIHRLGFPNRPIVYRGAGNGTFTSVPSPIAGDMYKASLRDMNRDGRLDLILTLNDNTLFISTQSSTGSFLAGATVSCGPGVQDLAVGDWNRDGIPDAALADSQGVRVFMGTGMGTFTSPGVSISARVYTGLCSGDFNRDGALDLAARESSVPLPPDRGVDVFLGTGAGSFGAARSFGTLEQFGVNVETWDANRDGNLDLIVHGIGDAGFTDPDPYASVDLLLGDGGGNFGLRTSHLLGRTFGGNPGAKIRVSAGDLNLDGVPDLFTGLAVPTPNLWKLRSILASPPDRGSGLQETAFYSTLNNPTAVAVGDLDRDGKLDVVTATQDAAPGVAVHLGTGNGALGAKTTLAQSWASQQVAVSDLNRDGILDVAASTSAFGAPRISTMLGLGDGTFGTRVDFPIVAGLDFEIGDMNRDGIPDVVTAVEDSVSVLLGAGDGTFTLLQSVALPFCYDLDLADLNRDGRLDVACAAGAVNVLYGNADGTLAAPVAVSSPVTHGQSIAVADFNRDGHPDLVAHQFNVVYIFYGASASPFSTSNSTTLTYTPLDLAVGEAAVNGLPYLYMTAAVERLEVLQYGLSGQFTPVASQVVTTEPFGLALGDLNGDGATDAITVGYNGSFVSVNLHGTGWITAVATSPAPRVRASLGQNFPNPFNPATTIRYSVPETTRARLDVFDVQGRFVARLHDGLTPAGTHQVRWDGLDRYGRPVASGVYLYRLRTESGFAESKRMVVVK